MISETANYPKKILNFFVRRFFQKMSLLNEFIKHKLSSTCSYIREKSRENARENTKDKCFTTTTTTTKSAKVTYTATFFK